MAMQLAGVDFTSAPSRRKPITVALGKLVEHESLVILETVVEHIDFISFSDWLRAPGPWLAAFDFPFGLPRELVESLGWPREWLPLMHHYTGLSRLEIVATFKAWCAARPVGGKFAHRACDAGSGASPSMKWVNPPVAFMLHAGVGLLLETGVHLPRLHDGDRQRVALEGYPGLVARELIGRRSYKSDARSKHTRERRAARADLVASLERGRSGLGLRLSLTDAQRTALVDDGSADRLDAVLCLMQAAWASGRPGYGLPDVVDPLEGWIVGAGPGLPERGPLDDRLPAVSWAKRPARSAGVPPLGAGASAKVLR